MQTQYPRRGKHYRTGQWICGDIADASNLCDGWTLICPVVETMVSEDSVLGEDEDIVSFAKNKGQLLGPFYFVIKDTVGVCSGFLDIDSELIFEGDILEDANNECFALVKASNTDGFYLDFDAVKNTRNPVRNKNFESTLLSLLLEFTRFRVIGNMYDSPELLSDGETHFSQKHGFDAGISTNSTSAKKHPIVTLVGSTKFKDAFTRAQRELSFQGNIVLSVPQFCHADNEQPTREQIECLEALHLRKIDMADRVYVINPGGYIGERTKFEIEYAKKQGKPASYLEEP